MATRVYKAGETIYQIGDKITEVSIIIKGNAEASSEHSRSTVTAGNILGIPEAYAGEHIFNITALDEVTVYSYKYTSPEDLVLILRMKPELGAVITHSMFRAISINIAKYETLLKNSQSLYKYIKDNYESYKTICSVIGTNVKSIPALDNLEPYQLKEKLDVWIVDYYKALKALPTEVKKEFFNTNTEICYGMVMEASKNLLTINELNRNMSEYISSAEDILLNEEEVDIFNLITGLAVKAYTTGKDTSEIMKLVDSITAYLQESYFTDKDLLNKRIVDYKDRIQNIDFTEDESEETESGDKTKLKAELVYSLDTILQYSRISEEEANAFKEMLEAYKALPDKNSIDTDARVIRKQLTSQFFDLYETVALRSFDDFGYPKVVRMFLYFGYLDEDLAGKANAEFLLKLVDRKHLDTEGHVFTLIEWLEMIYRGIREPSKNDLDLDYANFLREERKSGRIDEKEEKAFLDDKARKVSFEIRNMAKSANLITFGRISTYCPVFSKHNVIKKLETMQVNAPLVDDALENIKNIDYTAFYREVLYKNEEAKVSKEYIKMEVIPDVILMPNVGIRGGMWQEFYGADRKTPGRFLLPIFCTEDVKDIMIRLTGEFRWELCRRIQGYRWNDITDKSLTSEFTDYIQFYRKNSELSPEAKERIRLNLIKCKNNLREYFVREYLVWIKSESQGAARLNKISRSILNTYIPFAPAIRQTLRKNPMFGELMEKYDIKMKKELHNLEIRFSKIEKEGGKITPELLEYKEFLSN